MKSVDAIGGIFGQKHVIRWWNFSFGPIKAELVGKWSKCKQSDRFSSVCLRIFLICTIKRGVLARWKFAGVFPPGSTLQHDGKQFPENLFDFICPARRFTLWVDWKSEFIFPAFRRCEKSISAKFIGCWRNKENQARRRPLRDTSQLEPLACKQSWVVTVSKRTDNQPSKLRWIDANHWKDLLLEVSLRKSLERLTRSWGLRSNHFYLSKQSRMWVKSGGKIAFAMG